MVKEHNSKLIGPFKGWSPTTVYKLKNGTKWMLMSSKTSVKNLNSPKVEIWHDGKNHYMKVVNVEGRQKVRRVE